MSDIVLVAPGLGYLLRAPRAHGLQIPGRKCLFSRGDCASSKKRGPDLVGSDLQGKAA